MNPSNSVSPNADVRMKGFLSRTTVAETWRWIEEALRKDSRRTVEHVSLEDASGRILAEDVISRVNVPGFNRSMMDGYALLAEETYGATSYNVLSFSVIGTSLPGNRFPDVSFEQPFEL
ncbi:MAG: hypothetical protein U0936_17295 [Planctomycetaceae bacterium]